MSPRFPSVLRAAARGAACAFALAADAASAAPPALPGQHSYQGVLLDDQGVPRTGNVDLTLRVYDAASGGALLYKQVFLGVPLDSGVFTVTFGPTGSATDTPANPLTTSLAAALAGDLSGTGPSRFLEVTVGSEGALARTQILSVPYALRSASAESADVAATALEASNVNGLPASVVSEIYEHTNLDGSGPGNTDPSEGQGDTDGDGAANFVDADNDGDGLSDSAEVGQGSDINLVTPVLTEVDPPTGLTTTASTVTVLGANFEPGLAVEFGSQNPTPQNLTPGSFQVTVGPAPAGSVDVQVTRLNGQTALLPDGFAFIVPQGVTLALAGGTPLAATGTQRLAISGIDQYAVDRDASGAPENPLLAFPDAQNGELAVAWDPATGAIMGIRCRFIGLNTCNVEIARDTDADFDLADETAVFVEAITNVSTGRILSPSLVFDPAGRTVASYTKVSPSFALMVAHDRDGDGLFTGTNERVPVASGISTVSRPEGAVDVSGRVGLAWFVAAASNELRFAWDRSGDGDFADTVGGNPEIGVIAALGVSPVCLGAGFAPDGDLAVVWDTGTSGPTLARDRNGDGDFADAGEIVSLSASPGTVCDAHGMDGHPLAVTHNAGGTLRLLVDRNDDEDFGDADEDLFLDAVSPTRAAVARSQTGETFVAVSTASSTTFYADPTP
jgi:hypothetical protein